MDDEMLIYTDAMSTHQTKTQSPDSEDHIFVAMSTSDEQLTLTIESQSSITAHVPMSIRLKGRRYNVMKS